MITLLAKKSCSSCKAARQYLADLGTRFTERDFFRDRLSPSELTRLGRRAGGLRELVALRRRDELAHLSGSALAEHLANNPEHVRRPLFVAADGVLVGFTATVRDALSGASSAQAGVAR